MLLVCMLSVSPFGTEQLVGMLPLGKTMFPVPSSPQVPLRRVEPRGPPAHFVMTTGAVLVQHVLGQARW